MKNRIKLLLIVFVMMFITGCEVNYNLEFTDNALEENIDIILSEKESTDENKEKLQYSLEDEAYAISKQWAQNKYNIDVKEENNKYVGTLKYGYTVDNFPYAHLINQCYDSFSFVKIEDGYSLTTSDIFKCLVFSYLPVDKYSITITTNHLVSSHNADNVDGNKYIWIIKSNGDLEIEKPIKITFSDETQTDQMKDNLREKSNMVLIFILGGLFLIIGVIYIIYYMKNKRNS